MAQERLSKQESIAINQTMNRSGKDANQKTTPDELTTTATITTAKSPQQPVLMATCICRSWGYSSLTPRTWWMYMHWLGWMMHTKHCGTVSAKSTVLQAKTMNLHPH